MIRCIETLIVVVVVAVLSLLSNFATAQLVEATFSGKLHLISPDGYPYPVPQSSPLAAFLSKNGGHIPPAYDNLTYAYYALEAWFLSDSQSSGNQFAVDCSTAMYAAWTDNNNLLTCSPSWDE